MTAGRSTRRLGPASRAALRLLHCCPRIPTDVAARLLGYGHPGSAAQLLARLRAADLVRFETVSPGALLSHRAVRLWSLAPAAGALLNRHDVPPTVDDLGPLPYGGPERWRDPTRQAAPTLVAAWRVLAALTATIRPRPRVVAWECPWERRIDAGHHGRTHHVRVAAAAALRLDSSTVLTVLLLPDLGTAPVASYRPVLSRLLELRQGWPPTASGQEPLLVIATPPDDSEVRSTAWHTLLRQVSVRAGEPPLRVCILPRKARPASANVDHALLRTKG